MHQHDMRRRRIIASIAATVVSLACGTNYVYSAWAPQFAERLKLSSTESNLVGLFGNLGMYSMGPPIGMFIDHQNLGPRPAVFAGAFLLAIGYFPLHQAYDKAAGSVPTLCFFSYLTGFGSCMAFLASVKISAVNWPHHRGTATAFPLAAFGLSAFFFSFFGSILFPGDPSAFLELLSWGTFGLTFAGFFFLKPYPHTSPYHAVPGSEPGAGPSASAGQRLRRTSSADSKPRGPYDEPGTSTDTASTAQNQAPAAETAAVAATPTVDSAEDAINGLPDETSSLMSGASGTRNEHEGGTSVDADRSYRIDIRGLKLLASLDFWQLFSIMAIMAGVGLMTINNIGNDANALWKHYDGTVDEEFLVHRQQMHVSILSLCSFFGRLLSGIGSDFLVKKLSATRVWCLVVAGLIFTIAQLSGINISNPNYLFFVSGLSGLAYGLLFGVFPSIVAETFGIRGLSQNWGFMTVAPVISSNVFNLLYGTIFDHHSVVEPGGERVCHDGLECYRAAYGVTLVSCVVGVGVTLWVIRHQQLVRLREAKKAAEQD